MSYKKEVRRFRRELEACHSCNEVWFVDRDAERLLRPETYQRFTLEVRSKKENLSAKRSFHFIPVPRSVKRWISP